MAWRLHDSITVDYYVNVPKSEIVNPDVTKTLDSIIRKYWNDWNSAEFHHFNEEWFDTFRDWMWNHQLMYLDNRMHRVPFTALPEAVKNNATDNTGIQKLLKELNAVELDKSQFMLTLYFED